MGKKYLSLCDIWSYAEKLLPKFLSPEILISEYVEIIQYLDNKILRQDYRVNTLSKFRPLLGFAESRKEKKNDLRFYLCMLL